MVFLAVERKKKFGAIGGVVGKVCDRNKPGGWMILGHSEKRREGVAGLLVGLNLSSGFFFLFLFPLFCFYFLFSISLS